MSTKIVGTSFTNISDKIRDSLMSQNYWYQMGPKLKLDAYYKLVPEPSNKYDPNAIAVYIWIYDKKVWEKAGYLPKDTAASHATSQAITKNNISGSVTVYKEVPNYKFTIDI